VQLEAQAKELSMLNTKELAQKLVDSIKAGLEGLEAYEGGQLFDRYIDMGLPRNGCTGRQYSGRNILELWVAQAERRFACGKWMTYKQAQSLGANVRKGEKASHVQRVVRFTPEQEKAKAQAEGRKARELRSLKYFAVFNVLQIEGLPEQEAKPAGFEPEQHAEEFLQALQANAGLVIKSGYDGCFFTMHGNFIGMPGADRFKSQANYYKTIFHEIGHWTGHSSRLDRLQRFESREEPSYCKEELIADLCSAFLCAHLNIKSARMESHACYLNHYLELLEADPELIFEISKEAQRAANFALAAAGFEQIGTAEAIEVVPEAEEV
jgi:antirestriction protein ArdC